MNRTYTYHVMLGKRRTSATLDRMLADVLSIKLGQMPDTPDAHAMVRQWLQQRLEEYNDPGRVMVSQWLQDKALEFLLPPDLVAAYDEWRIADETILSGKLDKFISNNS